MGHDSGHRSLVELAEQPHPHVGEPQISIRWICDQLAGAEDCGYFGPGSAMWRIHSRAVLGLGIGRALLLELAHPWVAQAVSDHSVFRAHGRERFFGTIGAAELLIFGSRRQSDGMAAHIRDIHTRVNGVLTEDTGRWARGTRYSAEDPDALLWVLVTLVDTAILMYDWTFEPLDDRTVEAYLSEAERLGMMLGVREGAVPRSREALDEYIRSAIGDGTIAVSDLARSAAHDLANPSWPLRSRALSWPYRAASRAVAMSTIPDALRSQYTPILDPRLPPLLTVSRRAGQAFLARIPDRWHLDPMAAIAIQRAGA
jgi:uncharacterized protein (DUF2236 family)